MSSQTPTSSQIYIDLTQETKQSETETPEPKSSFIPPRPGTPNYQIWCTIRERCEDATDRALFAANHKAGKLLRAEKCNHANRVAALQVELKSWLQSEPYRSERAESEQRYRVSKGVHALDRELRAAEVRIKVERGREKEAITRGVEREFLAVLERREVEKREREAELASWREREMVRHEEEFEAEHWERLERQYVSDIVYAERQKVLERHWEKIRQAEGRERIEEATASELDIEANYWTRPDSTYDRTVVREQQQSERKRKRDAVEEEYHREQRERNEKRQQELAKHREREFARRKEQELAREREQELVRQRQQEMAAYREGLIPPPPDTLNYKLWTEILTQERAVTAADQRKAKRNMYAQISNQQRLYDQQLAAINAAWTLRSRDLKAQESICVSVSKKQEWQRHHNLGSKEHAVRVERLESIFDTFILDAETRAAGLRDMIQGEERGRIVKGYCAAREERRIAKEAEMAREAEQQRLAQAAEERRISQEAIERRTAAEAEQRRLVRQAGQRQLAQEAYRQRLLHEAEQQLAQKAEQGRLAQEEEQRRGQAETGGQREASQTEQRRTSDAEQLRNAEQGQKRKRTPAGDYEFQAEDSGSSTQPSTINDLIQTVETVSQLPIDCQKATAARKKPRQHSSHTRLITTGGSPNSLETLRRRATEKQEARRVQRAVLRFEAEPLLDHLASRRISPPERPETPVTTGFRATELLEEETDPSSSLTLSHLVSLSCRAMQDAYPNLNLDSPSTTIEFDSAPRYHLTVAQLTTATTILGLADHLSCAFAEARGIVQMMCLSSRSTAFFVANVVQEWEAYLRDLKLYQDGIDEVAEREAWRKEVAREKRNAKRRGEVWVPTKRQKMWTRRKGDMIFLPGRERYRVELVNWKEFIGMDGLKKLYEEKGMPWKGVDEEEMRLKTAAYPRYRTPPLEEADVEEEEEEEEEEEDGQEVLNPSGSMLDCLFDDE